MSKPENPLAFACASDNGHQPGMTLRDWFAGQALASMVNERAPVAGTRDGSLKLLAALCYDIADAMLAARKADAS